MALDTKEFIERLALEGYSHFCVVPCSFAKDVINEVINSTSIEYIASASEAVACSIAAGLKIGGAKPIVIVQSSGVTNMGSCITSLLKPYNITFPILTSWRTYKEGDSEIQHKYLASKLPNLIEAYGYEHTILDVDNLDTAISQIELCNNTNTMCIIKKDSFSKVSLKKEHQLNLSNFPLRSQFLSYLNNSFKNSDSVFIGTTGNTSREMYTYMPDTNNFYMVGNMGGALSLGLGVAKAKKKVFVCGGDAEFVMHMGGLATAGRYSNDIDLTYILFDNEANKSTGGQNSYQQHLDYINIALSCGFEVLNKTIKTLEDFSTTLDSFNTNKGLKFLHIKCDFDEETPRPPIDAIKVNKI